MRLFDDEAAPSGLPDNRLQQPLAEAFGGLPEAWAGLAQAFVASPAGQRLCTLVDERRAAGVEVFPADPLRALRGLTPAQVKVVILGQDPYHGSGEAQGLAFSVPDGVKIPPSLRNIRRELADDLGGEPTGSGDLSPWVEQGVLLLNTSLTVERDRPASHAKAGWAEFTDAVIGAVADDPSPKVFLLWGAHAQRKAERVRQSGHAHAVFESNHPSPLSALRPPAPFLGSRPFSRANAWLQGAGVGPIEWLSPAK
ncbi:MAG TPA: uracil-DNA glycosylase [Burkholderiaceae bacterium]|nr:uracil-DNA glycosylase [Burkholderiaceae bacterium]HMZ01549.1 uracil-DNA glycosylase [Burkholderiaceae bacterium]HNB46571.1 uracil-DNA glycosylase [Burkholderiaceae bacterium]HNG81786.1 uracil-DNA glycosylase [Burkholderiaceae bacterium]